MQPDVISAERIELPLAAGERRTLGVLILEDAARRRGDLTKELAAASHKSGLLLKIIYAGPRGGRIDVCSEAGREQIDALIQDDGIHVCWAVPPCLH